NKPERLLDEATQPLPAPGPSAGMDPRRFRMRHGIADERVALGHSVQIVSPWPKNQVRVMIRRSVSRRMSGGKAAKGAAMRTILNAASSSTFRPEERSSSIDSTLPSGRMVTLRRRLPYILPRASAG